MSDDAPLVQALITAYPVLDKISVAQLEVDLAACAVLLVDRDRAMFDEGASCAEFPLLLKGEVRVARATAHGREIGLYRVRAGEFCMVSAACLFGGHALPASAHTVQTTLVVVVPRETFLRWTDDRGLRAALLSALAGRISELMGLNDTVLSQRLDSRLANALLGQERIMTHTTNDSQTTWALRARSCRVC